MISRHVLLEPVAALFFHAAPRRIGRKAADEDLVVQSGYFAGFLQEYGAISPARRTECLHRTMRITRSDALRRISGASATWRASRKIRRVALNGISGSRYRSVIAVSDKRGVRTLHVGGEAIQ